MVVSAVPGALGFQTLRAVIDARRTVVDIAFFPEDPFALSEAADKAGIQAVVDCGVAPGLSNVLVGHVRARPGLFKTDASSSGPRYPNPSSWIFRASGRSRPSTPMKKSGLEGMSRLRLHSGIRRRS